ncbi:MAG: hypothetical protein ACOC4M_14505, partial [Promethearchaeia archaeon]
KHWDMPTWKIDTIETVEIKHGNFSFDYDRIGPVAETTEFGYDDETVEPIKASEWGDWGINNWMRDLFAMLLNLLIIVINQFILWVVYGSLYAVNLALNWFFVGLIVGIIAAFFWNVPIYYVVDSAVALGWFIWEALIVFIKWFWKDILEPAFEYMMNDLLPVLIKLFFAVLALIFASIITLFAGEDIGGEYYNEVYEAFMTTFNEMASFLLQITVQFFTNFDVILQAISMYVLFSFLGLVSIIIVEAKGDKEEGERLRVSLRVYIFPFLLILDLIKRIRDASPKVAGSG